MGGRILGLLTGLLVLAAAAPSYGALDHPPRSARSFSVQTVFGTCFVTARAETTAPPAGAGSVSSSQTGDCERLSLTPYSIWHVSEIIDLAPTEPVTGGGQRERFCPGVRSCTFSQSRSPMPPGDYSVEQRVAIDLTNGAGSSTYYTSYPSECRLSHNDTGTLNCFFSHRVTLLPAAPALPALPAL